MKYYLMPLPEPTENGVVKMVVVKSKNLPTSVMENNMVLELTSEQVKDFGKKMKKFRKEIMQGNGGDWFETKK